MKGQKEFEAQLDAYVDAYMAQRRAISGEETDEDVATEAVHVYMQQCGEYVRYVSEVFDAEDPALPQMNVFFTAEGKYSDFSRRIYQAYLERQVCHPGDEWKLFAMAYIGDVLRENQTTIKEDL